MGSTVGRLDIKDWILVPALITLGVTVVRLLGEMLGGPQILFGSEAGGGFSLVGIVWLVLIFGVYFGKKLARLGYGPASGGGRAALGLLLALAVIVAGALLAILLVESLWMQAGLFVLFSWVSIFIGQRAWPEAGQILTAYGLAARIPVAALMLPAILNRWGTHYDKPPPDFPAGIPPFQEWILVGLVPQLSFWIAFTVIVGGLAAVAGAALARR